MLAGAHPDAGRSEQLALAQNAVRSLPAAGAIELWVTGRWPPSDHQRIPRQAIEALFTSDNNDAWQRHGDATRSLRPAGQSPGTQAAAILERQKAPSSCTTDCSICTRPAKRTDDLRGAHIGGSARGRPGKSRLRGVSLAR
jgi:hypothetical protein